MMLEDIELPMAEIEQFCKEWNLTEFALFGSVLRDDFRQEGSDIDVMVQFHPETLSAFEGFDYFGVLDQMEAALQSIFGREVDVVVRSGVEQSSNYLRRHEILSTAQTIYDASRSSISA